MVGVPRSRGCLLCVRRHVRCDMARPGCAKCLGYGAECPGYERMAKFVANKHEMKKRGRGERKGESRQEGRQEGRQEDKKTEMVKSTVSSISSVSSVSSSTSTVQSLPLVLPLHNRAAFIGTMLDLLNLDRRPTELIVWGPWFDHVPRRLGVKATLDSAVCAFAMHVLGKGRRDAVLIQRSRQLYGQSLMALQRALDHPVEWRSSETLCSCMVLCMYELFADTTETSTAWTKHAQGVTRLMQQRGVDGYTDPWDRSMLFSFRALIIMNALETGQECFLAKKKWQRVLSNLADMPDPVLSVFPPGAFPVVNRHVMLLARLPAVLQSAWSLREDRLHGLPVDPAQVSLLQRAATSLHADFRSWFESAGGLLGDPIFVPVPADPALVAAGGPVSPYPVVLDYANTWVGTVYVTYLSAMLVIQEGLNQCAAVRAGVGVGAGAGAGAAASAQPFDGCNRHYCRLILQSFESLGRGLMGQYRIGFCMRIVYEFVDVPTQLWIRALLDRAGAVYASSRSDVYPRVQPNEFNYH